MDRYFIRYSPFKANKVKFITMKLTEQAGEYWTNVKTSRKARFQRSIETWFAMKGELKGKYGHYITMIIFWTNGVELPKSTNLPMNMLPNLTSFSLASIS